MFLTPQTIALIVCIPALAFFLVKWLYQVDETLVHSRRAAGHMAATLQKYGLKRIPEFLFDYSYGDTHGMLDKIASAGERFMEGEEAVLKELHDVFMNVLAAELKTEEGMALVLSKVEEAKAVIAAPAIVPLALAAPLAAPILAPIAVPAAAAAALVSAAI